MMGKKRKLHEVDRVMYFDQTSKDYFVHWKGTWPKLDDEFTWEPKSKFEKHKTRLAINEYNECTLEEKARRQALMHVVEMKADEEYAERVNANLKRNMKKNAKFCKNASKRIRQISESRALSVKQCGFETSDSENEIELLQSSSHAEITGSDDTAGSSKSSNENADDCDQSRSKKVKVGRSIESIDSIPNDNRPELSLVLANDEMEMLPVVKKEDAVIDYGCIDPVMPSSGTSTPPDQQAGGTPHIEVRSTVQQMPKTTEGFCDVNSARYQFLDSVLAQAPLLNAGLRKEWHTNVQCRRQIFGSFMNALWSFPITAANAEQLKEVIVFARDRENDFFWQANGRDEYVGLIGRKIEEMLTAVLGLKSQRDVAIESVNSTADMPISSDQQDHLADSTGSVGKISVQQQACCSTFSHKVSAATNGQLHQRVFSLSAQMSPPGVADTSMAWHTHVDAFSRVRVACGFVSSIVSGTGCEVDDGLLEQLLVYARRCENEIFQKADCVAAYRGCIQQKIREVQLDVQEKKHERMQRSVGGNTASSMVDILAAVIDANGGRPPMDSSAEHDHPVRAATRVPRISVPLESCHQCHQMKATADRVKHIAAVTLEKIVGMFKNREFLLDLPIKDLREKVKRTKEYGHQLVAECAIALQEEITNINIENT